MAKSFIEKIRTNSIVTPVKKNFTLDKWDENWRLTENKTDKCQNAYNAGIVLNSAFQNIRNELDKLYDKSPKITNENLLMLYIGIANRDRSIFSKILTTEKIKTNIFSSTFSNNAIGNEITAMELADGCVDGISHAIHNCMLRIKKNLVFSKNHESIPILDFIHTESVLSQIYGTCESYWKAIVWGDYSFSEVDADNNIYAISQKPTTAEIGYEVSQIRRHRLNAQLAQIASAPNIVHQFDNDKYLEISKIGKKKRLIPRAIRESNEKTKFINSNFRANTLFLDDEFPTEIINKSTRLGFSIQDILNVFRILTLLSHKCEESFPSNDGIENAKKLLHFCPRFNKADLKQGIEKATGYKYDIISNIMFFLEFDASSTKDLWCHPIISLNGDYALLTSALSSPSITRLVEHWLVNLKINLQEKGKTFEETILTELNHTFDNNPLINDFDKSISKRFKFESGEEEIDLLARVGSVILLGEAKSIVTTDSPISQFRALETLKKASNQVLRKKMFVEKNIRRIFEALSWNFDDSTEYIINGFVINSNSMYAGFIIQDIPICDNKILINYFRQSTTPLISKTIDSKVENLAWSVLYNNFTELQKNFNTYIKFPPQIHLSFTKFDCKKILIPLINDNFPKILYRRLIPSDFSISDIPKKESIFPIVLSDNFEKHIQTTDFLI